MNKIVSIAMIVLGMIVATILIDLSFSMLDVRAYVPGLGEISVGPGGSQGRSGGSGSDGTGTSSPASQAHRDGQAEARPGTVGQVSPVSPSSTVRATVTPVPSSPGSTLEKLATRTTITDYSSVLYCGDNISVAGIVTDSKGNHVSGTTIDVRLTSAAGEEFPCGKSLADSGVFAVGGVLPGDLAVGDYSLIARTGENVQYLGSEDTKKARVKAETSLRLDFPARPVAGEQVPVDVLLTEKVSGRPLSCQTVSLSSGFTRIQMITDDRGVARENMSFSSGGSHAVTATYAGKDYYAGSSAREDLPVENRPASDWLRLAGLLILLSFLAQIALIMAALVGFFIVIKVKKPAPAEKLPQVPVPEAAPVPTNPLYRIEYPSIPAPLPAVWGVGEPLEIAVFGPHGEDIGVVLCLDGKPAGDLAIAAGTARASILPAKGQHWLTIQTTDTGAEVLAASKIHVVDYREEIVRGFNDLFSSIRSKFGEIQPDVTPREMQYAVREHISPAQQSGLEQVISIFEIANYSLHGVSRDDYLRSYISAAELKL